MDEENPQHNASHAVFGLNDDKHSRSGSDDDPGGQGAMKTGSWGMPVLIIVVLALCVLTGTNLFLAVQAKKTAASHAEALALLTGRMNASDDNYAQLKAQFEVTAEKLGMTQGELTHERALAANIERQQRIAVYRLSRDLRAKANAKDVNNDVTQLQSEASNISQNLVGTQKDLDATKQALTDTNTNLTGQIAHTHA